MYRLTKVLASITAAFALTIGGAFAMPDQAHAANSGGEQVVYRLYNRITSEHLYTTDANEVNILKRGDWNYEGVAWVAPKQSDSPVWRLYSPGLGDHHYTRDANEVAVLTSKHGWQNEGEKWYSDDLMGTPIWRQYNPQFRVGQHHYTADHNEYTVNNARNGWKGEGVAWYALNPGWAPGAKKVSAARPTISDDPTGEILDTVTIPSSSGVVYYVNGKKAPAGTYPVTDYANYVLGSDNWTRAQVEVVAEAVLGYDLNGAYKWNQTVIGSNVSPTPTPTPMPQPTTGRPTAPAPTPTSAQPTASPSVAPTSSPTGAQPTTSAKKDVKAVKPTFTHKDGKADTITIPNVAGLKYTISGDKKTQTVKAGTYKVSDFSTYPGNSAPIKVTVKADDGYQLVNDDGSRIASKTYSVNFDGNSTPTSTPTTGKPTASASPTSSATPSPTPSSSPSATSSATPTPRNVKAKAPTFTHKDGKADTITIPNVAGLQYTISGDKKTQVVAPGTYKASSFSTYPNNKAPIKVTIAATEGYQLVGDDGAILATRSWDTTFDGTTSVSAKDVTFSDESGKANDTFSIPNVTGVDYYVNGMKFSAGTYKVADHFTYTDHKVKLTATVQAQSGYVLSETSSWWKNYSDLIKVTADPAVINKERVVFVIPSVVGVQYYANGKAVGAGDYKPADSDYDVNGEAQVTVTVKAKDGYELTNPNARWIATFSKPTPTPTPTPSSTPTPTSSASSTPTSTPTPTPTQTPTSTPTPTPTPTPTVQSVTATAPTFRDGTGDNDTVVIPNVTGVQYKINGVNAPAGTANVSDYAEYVTGPLGNRQAHVTVTVEAKTGYKLTNPNAQWTKNGNGSPFWGASATATPVEPTWNDRAGEGNDTYTIPTVQGVKYTVNGQTVTGTITVPTSAYTWVNGVHQATVTVKAEKDDSIQNSNWQVTPQTYTHTFTGNQIQSVTPTAPTFTDNAGEMNDTFTIPSTPGVNYYVNGVSTPRTAGTYTHNAAYTSNGNLQARTSTLSIEARPTSDTVVLNGTTTWNYTYTGLKETASQQPGVDADYVGGVATAIITIPNIEGVQYSIDGQNVNAGVHYATYGDAHQILAHAKEGYILTSYYNQWDIPGSGGGSHVVSPTAPVFTDQVGTASDTITIPSVTGIYYTINGQRVNAGVHKVADYATYTNHFAEVTVKAVAENGYAISGTNGWWQQFLDTNYVGGGGSGGNDPNAIIVDTNANEPHQWISGIRGYYELPKIEGIQWQVDGVDADPDTYTVTWISMPKTVTVTAVAKPGYQIKSGSNYMWVFSFTR